MYGILNYFVYKTVRKAVNVDNIDQIRVKGYHLTENNEVGP